MSTQKSVNIFALMMQSLFSGLMITVMSFIAGIVLITVITVGEEIKHGLVIVTVILMHMIYMLVMGNLVTYVWKRKKINHWPRLGLFIVIPLISPYLLPRNGLLILGILIVLASLATYDALTTQINQKGT